MIKQEFRCCYCWGDKVIGLPVSLLMCGKCLLRSCCMGTWEAFWFSVYHGPIVK